MSLLVESESSQQFEEYEVTNFDILSIQEKYGLSLYLKHQKGRQIYRYFNTIDGIEGLETDINDKKLIAYLTIRKDDNTAKIPYIFRNVDKGNEFVEKTIEILLNEKHNLS